MINKTEKHVAPECTAAEAQGAKLQVFNIIEYTCYIYRHTAYVHSQNIVFAKPVVQILSIANADRKRCWYHQSSI